MEKPNTTSSVALGIIGGIILLLSIPLVFNLLSMLYHQSIETVMSSTFGMAVPNIIFGILLIILGISVGVKATKPVAILMIVFGLISAVLSFVLFGGFLGMIGGVLGGIGGNLALKKLQTPPAMSSGPLYGGPLYAGPHYAPQSPGPLYAPQSPGPLNVPPQQLVKPAYCAKCGGVMADRRCSSCRSTWCSNCGTWNEPEAERCASCQFMLPVS
nr:hypothetical protein [Candidatus Sigynarchaeota archaeon]